MGWSGFSLSLWSPAWPRGPPLSVSHKDAVKCDDVIEATLLGAKPLCSARTTKKSLCSSDSKRIGQCGGRVHLFPRGRVTVLVHKPLIQPSGPYLFPPNTVIQASGKPWCFSVFLQCAVTWLIFYSGGIRLCRLQSHHRILENVYSWCSPIKGKFEIHKCGIFAHESSLCHLSDLAFMRKKQRVSWCRLFIILYMRFNVALFLDSGFVRHSSRSFSLRALMHNSI